MNINCFIRANSLLICSFAFIEWTSGKYLHHNCIFVCRLSIPSNQNDSGGNAVIVLQFILNIIVIIISLTYWLNLSQETEWKAICRDSVSKMTDFNRAFITYHMNLSTWVWVSIVLALVIWAGTRRPGSRN